MTTKHNTPTRSKSVRHNGKAGNDTNPLMKFQAELFWTQYNRATVTIEARSHEEARQQANAISSEDVDDWNPFDGEIYVASVGFVEEGKTSKTTLHNQG
jgi:hypothetical protein